MTGSPLFRIRGSSTLESSSPSITLGTVSRCSLALRDPLASEEHCRISRAQDHFEVEDLASATGTYLNGVEVAAQATLRVGDVLIVGSSRLRVESVGTNAQPLLELTLDEACFYYQASGRGGARRDADAWVHWEVGFGRLPGLRMLGWMTATLAAFVLAAPWIVPGGRAWLSAGPLMSVHAALLERPERDLRADPHLASASAIAQREGCSSCHASGGGTPMSKCAACHVDKVSTRHPFAPAPIQAGELSAGWDEGACIACHAEHEGPGRTNGPLLVSSAAETCPRCHSDEQRARAAAHLSERRQSAQPVEKVMRQVALPAAEFSHRSHVALPGVACDTCHGSAHARGSATDREFSPVSFDTCQSCHGAHPEQLSPAGVRLAGRLQDLGLVFDVPLHGSEHDGALCRECHAEAGKPALLTQVRDETDVRFRFPRRRHAGEFADGGEDCAHCHRSGVPADSELAAPFRHDLHLSEVEPRTNEERERASRDCLACHAGQWDEKTLAGAHTELAQEILRPRNCGKCHRRDDGQSIEPAVEHGATRSIRARTAFPHDRHVAVPGGCFACHAFGASDESVGSRPITSQAVADCTACHGRHENLGRACTRCHARLDEDVRHEPELHDWPYDRGFSHRTKGHEQAGALESCGPCHAGIAAAGDVRSIPIPAESDALCIDCHIQKGAVFHFGIGGH